MSGYTLAALTAEDARTILHWRYAPPYDLYDMGGAAAEAESQVAFFCESAQGYFGVYDGDAALVGFCCFGVEGQVPGGDYSADALDVGVGMRPELTGQGRGTAFAAAVLAFGIDRYAARLLRVTVATFNRRSLRVWETLGFQPLRSFWSTTRTPQHFVVLVCPASDLAPIIDPLCGSDR